MYVHVNEKSLTNTAVTFTGVRFLKDSFTYCCEDVNRVTDKVRGG